MADHTHRRVIATIALVEGQDDELIAHLAQFGHGQRAAAIKALMRRGLGLAEPVAVQQPAPDALIEQLRTEQAESVRWMQEWISHLQQRIDALQAAPGVQQVATVEAVPQIDEEDAARLQANLKKARW